MQRRNFILGTGALLFGSGAVSVNATLNNSVQPSGDMRVVAQQGIIVRAGQAFKDDGSVRSGYQDDYVEYNDGSGDIEFFEDAGLGNNNPEGLVDIAAHDLPVATVNRRDQNINDDVKMQVAIPNGIVDSQASGSDRYTMTFVDILEIVNETSNQVDIGIAYDRSKSGSWDSTNNNGMYGEDVKPGGNTSTEITEQIVQHIYQFKGKDPNGTFTNKRISPDPNDKDDEPPQSDFATIDPGNKINVDLEIDLTAFATIVDVRPKIDAAAENDTSDPFDKGLDTVDLLDAIDVGKP